MSWQDKVDQIQQRVADNSAGALVMHALDETACKSLSVIASTLNNDLTSGWI